MKNIKLNKHSGSFVYIVEMLRYGDRESHSYVAGVYSDQKLAEYNARLHMSMRAGKYSAEIFEEQVDGYGGRSLVAKLSDYYDEDYDLEDDIKSREDWLKYRYLKYKDIREKTS